MRLVIAPLQYDNLSRISVRQLEYDGTMASRMKQIQGSRWAPELRCWHIPYTPEAWAALKSLFADYQIVKEEQDDSIGMPVTYPISAKDSLRIQEPEHAVFAPTPPFQVATVENLRQTLREAAALPTVSKGRFLALPNPDILRPENKIGISLCPDNFNCLALHLPFHLVAGARSL